MAHLHSCFRYDAKQTSTITKSLVRLFDTHQIPYETNVTIRVKKVTDLIGMFHYLTKELEGKPLVLTGWRMAWIRQQCLDNLKKMPRKMLVKDDAFIDMRSSVGLVLEYSKRKGIPIAGRTGFRSCLCAMAREGYRFEKIKIRQLYIHVLAQLGDSRPFGSFIDNELQFLDG